MAELVHRHAQPGTEECGLLRWGVDRYTGYPEFVGLFAEQLSNLSLLGV